MLVSCLIACNLRSLNPLSTSFVPSVDALSDTTTSKLGYVCDRAEATQPVRHEALLKVGIAIVISGLFAEFDITKIQNRRYGHLPIHVT